MKIQMIGKTFGRLTVLEEEKERVNGRICYKCKCECGNIIITKGKYLRNGDTKSCGCLVKETSMRIGSKNKTHGLSKLPEYNVYTTMINRCNNPNHDRYHRYGGRGIKVCDRWLESFENFYEDMGERPTDEHQLDRVNGKENYTPENCRWVTSTINNANKNKKDDWGLTVNKNKTCRVTISREYIIRTFVFKDKKTGIYYRDKWVKDYEENPKRWIEKTKNKSYRNEIK